MTGKKRHEDNVKLSEEAALAREEKPAKGDRAEVPTETDLVAELAKAREEAAQIYDKYLRLAAEFENYKKRVERDKSDLLNFCNENLLRELLPALDSIERALEHAQNTIDFNAFLEGFKLIRDKVIAVLGKFGVEPIEALGKPFDPNYHEAMMQVETDRHDHNFIVEEYEKGYLLNGRLLRPSKVSVAKNVSDKISDKN
ncbi:MAG: nucleotide exchange factor GrpE [Deltaproteobacteria bacterium]|nr:nucleotide exchange factor GrpE [Deltaproteobacteria bacterium]